MIYVLQFGEGRFARYVTPADSEKSYTPKLQDARVFPTKAAADKEACRNERTVAVESAS